MEISDEGNFLKEMIGLVLVGVGLGGIIRGKS